MKKSILIIFISLCFASVLMPGGYGSWKKSIVFSGTVNVEPAVAPLSSPPPDPLQTVDPLQAPDSEQASDSGPAQDPAQETP